MRGQATLFKPMSNLKETGRASEAFRRYCELGPRRSLAKLSNTGIASLNQIELWSSSFGWVRRAAEYDEEQAALRREKQEQAIDDMIAEQAREGRAIFQAVGRLLREQIQDGEVKAPAVNLLKVSSEMWARVLGQATQRLELTGNAEAPLHSQSHVSIDLRKCTPEELDALEKLAAKLEGEQ